MYTQGPGLEVIRGFLPACCLGDFLDTAMKKSMSYVKSELFSGLKGTVAPD
jgi:hypothetical protein